MNMLWNTQIIDTCIVFPGWQITSNAVFVFSFFTIVALGVLYEWLRVVQKRLDVNIATRMVAETPSLSGRSSPHREDESLMGRGVAKRKGKTVVPPIPRILRALLYGANVFLSFFLMLVFMTYNAYLILAVVVGAAFGYYIFESEMDVEGVLAGASGVKGMACH